jgi:hypothetical protein
MRALWRRRRPEQSTIEIEIAEVPDPIACLSCGRLLDGDPEDEPDDPGGAICGECNRERNFAAVEELEWSHE